MMTPAERADAIRRCGYREPLPTDVLYGAGALVVASIAATGFGVWGLFFGEDGGMRWRGAVMLALGLFMGWRQWIFYGRPVAPSDDDDLARELRQREALDADGD